MSNIFKLNFADVAGAVLSAVIVAVLGYLSSVTNIFAVDLNQVLNVAVLTAIASLVKAFTTNSDGTNVLGFKVK